jgi:4-hydroxybenzoate polyprenyltransferase
LKTFLAYLRLTRPANIITAVADIMAGYSVAWCLHFLMWDMIIPKCETDLYFLILATIGLYGGGVVMNDVADVEIDKVERPERPIPSGKASRKGAAILGISLLVLGIFSAAIVSMESAIIASSIAILALVYDFFGKHSKFLGPINMGLCRGGNLLLGMSATSVLFIAYPIALLPIIYIAAITMISRGEVVGGNKIAISYAALMYGVVIAGLIFIAFFLNHHEMFIHPKVIYPLGFISLFAILIFMPLIIAYKNPEPMKIRGAVKAGVISLIVMDASLAACFGGWISGLVILGLLPISILLAKIFAVT